ncbi:hypothetical protein PABG_11060 [Paracoccidioides brasiliensis Pb03]|uniref:Uncharacterized protein n=1 Tax=Paracoccidioides brasiliensis (strain Pb18) TaxID=502780 RepID=A0A0A0HVB1_PARBD|nr:uncharacterized protein PADG_11448 [Paracoccidioides brasiliensis Pb18]KGM92263.1 hypothetical protein PADG_11448 [Paracoccidioides brasiliensis Pb18]KGY15824.1 hypothetical protein PABG_11060 [Paracoccidioides brasiliensis Pb03]
MIDRAASTSLAAAPSLFSATMRVPTEIGRGRSGCLERLPSLNEMESASAVNGLPRTDVTESEFWKVMQEDNGGADVCYANSQLRGWCQGSEMWAPNL